MKALVAIIVAALTGLMGPSAWAQDLAAVTVEVSPSSVELDLGQGHTIDVTVTNHGDQTVAAVVAHIDITSLEESGSVDPEDWSSTLSRDVGMLEPGQARTVRWELQPISPGSFTLYAVALAAGSDTVAVSDTLTIAVADRRSLNPGGILPVAIAAPAAVAGLLGIQIRRGRRS